MEALYFQTNGLIQETQQCFQQLSTVRVDSFAVEADIQTKLAAVNAYDNLPSVSKFNYN